MTNPNPESGDVNQTEQINDGMQGADGSVDANGMDTAADSQEKLDELRENLGTLNDR